jgi:hypothetical protein
MPLLEQSVELARTAGDGMHFASTLIEFGRQLVQHSSADQRIPALLREGLELSTALGEPNQIVECLEALAALSARRGSPETGAELIGAAEGERDRAGVKRTPDQLPFFEETIRELEQSLGPEAYARELERGRGQSIEAAVAVGLRSTKGGAGPGA